MVDDPVQAHDPAGATPSAAPPDPFLCLRVGDVSCPVPVFVDESASVALAARAMRQAGATAALVKRGAGTIGILTERDVLTKVVAAELDAGRTLVTAVMTPGLVTARTEDLLIEAFSRMVRHGIRRLVLVDGNGQPVGLLGERDMLAARGESPLALAQDISTAVDQAGLARCFERLRRVAGLSIAEGIGSRAVGRLISEMHDRLMARAWEMALAAVQAEFGPAPAPHAVLVLGSQARREQFLATDQDLALVYEGGGEAAGWFAEFGTALTKLLLAVGFPACPKRIMLDNPDWRASLNGWLNLLDATAERPDAEGVVRAALLADLRPLAGDADLGGRLRQAVLARLGESSVLLKYMAREATRFAPPLEGFGGRIGGLLGMSGSAGSGLAVRRDGPKKGSLDIKRGLFPVALGAKVLALDHGLDEIGTDTRLAALERADALSPALARGLAEGYDYMQTLRMRHQARQLRHGQAPDNDLLPADLGALEQGRLRAAFKLVAEFQSMLFEKYGLRMLG